MKYPTSCKISDKAERVSAVISTLCNMVDDIYRMVDEIAPEDLSPLVTDMGKLDEARSCVYDAIDTLDEVLRDYTTDAEDAARDIEAAEEEDINAGNWADYRAELSALAYDYRYR